MRNRSENEELRSIWEMLEREDVPAAIELLDSLRAQEVDDSTAIEAELLRANAFLLERRFGALRSQIAELRAHALADTYRREIDTIDAHGRALVGESTAALRLIIPVIRDCEPFSEDHARAVHISGICLFRRGHYGWARKHLDRAVAFYRLAGDRVGLSLTLNTLALLEKSTGRLSVALDLFDEAASLVPIERYPRHHCRLLSNRGVCLLKLGRAQEAESCFLAALAVASESRDVSASVALSNNLGHCYRMQGRLERALECFVHALQDAREASSVRQMCLSLEFAGEALTETGELDRALDYLERAYDLAAKLAPQGDLMMEVLRRRGELYSALGKFAEAEADLERAIHLCGARGERREKVLAERAVAFLRFNGARIQESLEQVLRDLRDLGDRFEYVRTVYLGMKGCRREFMAAPWAQDALVIATYYADSLGVEFWKERLREVAGHARPVVPRPGSAQGLGLEVMTETRSHAYTRCLEAANLAARSDCAALIVGETGVGKEIIARMVHERSRRTAGPMVAINCGALPESLAESELFGHARGTFTGAHRDKEGLFEVASGGTVLLDEIGDLPARTQVKLLRFLDTGEFRRVGETRTRRADVRVLAATNRDLRGLVDEGAFREDLLFRLNVFQIDVPPLRARREDILALARFFLSQACRPGMGLTLSEEAKDCLEAHDWPGNIREMKNLCQYLAARAWGRGEIRRDDLPEDMLRRIGSPPEAAVLSKFERQRRDLERDQIVEALRQSDGRILHAAKLLGMNRNTLASRMRELGVARRI